MLYASSDPSVRVGPGVLLLGMEGIVLTLGTTCSRSSFAVSRVGPLPGSGKALLVGGDLEGDVGGEVV